MNINDEAWHKVVNQVYRYQVFEQVTNKVNNLVVNQVYKEVISQVSKPVMVKLYGIKNRISINALDPVIEQIKQTLNGII